MLEATDPPSPGRGRVLAIANQKGGVGKTTTAINLGTALAASGRAVLIVDLDAQGNASTGLGIDRKDRTVSSYDVLTGELELEAAAIPTAVTTNQMPLCSATPEIPAFCMNLIASM